MKSLNMIGKPCPIPVVEAKKTLMTVEKGVVVIVDNEIAVENLQKMALGEGHKFSYRKETNEYFEVEIIKMNSGKQEVGNMPVTSKMEDILSYSSNEESTAVLITKDFFGGGNNSYSIDLGKILIKGFIFSLSELNSVPTSIIFLNSGAYLTSENSNTLEDLQILQNFGCRIVTCGTCVNFYDLQNKIAIGTIVNMYEITEILSNAKKVITI